mgnify:CR=1 FL=1
MDLSFNNNAPRDGPTSKKTSLMALCSVLQLNVTARGETLGFAASVTPLDNDLAVIDARGPEKAAFPPACGNRAACLALRQDIAVIDDRRPIRSGDAEPHFITGLDPKDLRPEDQGRRTPRQRRILIETLADRMHLRPRRCEPDGVDGSHRSR